VEWCALRGRRVRKPERATLAKPRLLEWHRKHECFGLSRVRLRHPRKRFDGERPVWLDERRQRVDDRDSLERLGGKRIRERE